jgi:energy-coupling factor transporter ATP-binding protein EcfA2
MVEIGLGYLSLDRESSTLSGGEAQRVKLVRHLGSSLTDVTYVFDEPTVGLHPHDIQRMNDLLLQLRDKATLCWSSSTSRRRSVSPTTWSISDPAPARQAAGSATPAIWTACGSPTP